MKWDLTKLFKDEKEFYNEIDKLEQLLILIDKYSNIEIDLTKFEELISKQFLIMEKANNILIYGSLRYYKNIKDDNTIKMKKDAEELKNKVTSNLKFIDKIIIDLGKEQMTNYINSSEYLNRFKIYFDNIFRLKEHIPSENVISKIKDYQDKINLEINEFNMLNSNIKYGTITVDNKELEITSSNFGKYINAKNRETRAQTYDVVNNAFLLNSDSFSNILKKIYKYRNEISILENYDSVLERSLFIENIDSIIVKSLINTVNDNLSIIQKYLEIKANYFNIKEPHLYDFGVSIIDKNTKKYTIEEAKEIIYKALVPLGEEYITVVKKLLADGYFDTVNDENKHQTIVFSWHCYSFMNFKGSYNDLKNMIHELGHIVNYYMAMKKQPFIYEDSTIFVGETASLINEILLNNYLAANALDDDDKIFYLSKNIENYFMQIYKQTMYTEFENKLYNITKNNGELSTPIISNTYEEIIKKYYGEKITYDSNSNIEWTRLGHLYRHNYYTYNYATGLLIASMVVSKLLNNELETSQYLEFLKSGSNNYSLELLKILDIDFTNISVINKGFENLENNVNELEKLLIKTV